MVSTSASEPSSAMKRSPNWLEMPQELMANILERLGTKEILKSARKVCKTWQRICKDPAMWKVIEMRKSPYGSDTREDLDMLIIQAINLSCGELIEFSIHGFATDYLMERISGSKKLKRIFLHDFGGSGDGLSMAVNSLPQLEELHLSSVCITAQDIEAIGRNCPQLKSFMLNKHYRGSFIHCNDHALAVANNMPELRHLQLSGNKMTNDGLQAILDGCPHLQSLDVSKCDSLDLGGDLGKLCVERIKDFNKHDSTEKRWGFTEISDVYEFSEADSYEGDFYEHWYDEDDPFYED